jgi:hypothetical protein
MANLNIGFIGTNDKSYIWENAEESLIGHTLIISDHNDKD